MLNKSNQLGVVLDTEQSNALAHETSRVFTYEGTEITFQNDKDVMVSATQMAKAFDKRPTIWLSSQQAKEFLSEFSKVKKMTLPDLVQINRGGSNPGTWMHQDVALEFARWLSPAFAIWTNDRIKELMITGVATVANDDEAILHAMTVLQNRVNSYKQRTQILEGENKLQQEQISVLAPKAEYADKVLQSTSTFTTSQIAQGLKMSAVTLNRKLKELGIQYKQSKTWMLYAKYRDMGIADIRINKYVNKDDEIVSNQYMVWTEKGRKFIHELAKGGKL